MNGNDINPEKLEEYKLIIDDTARFTDRRQNTTNTYITVNSIILAALAFLVKDAGADDIWKILLPIPLILAGFVVAIFWRQLIMKYKRLVGVRMDVLLEMENSIKLSGLEKIYHVEEEKLYPRDETREKTSGFSDLEVFLPNTFAAIYIIFGILIVVMPVVR